MLDVASALAALAVERDYVRPDGRSVAASSPSKAAGIRWSSRRCISEPFVANDCDLTAQARRGEESGCSPARTWPASRRSCARTRSSPCWRRWAASCRRSARTIGVVDRLFSRVGAADDLARGRSTFMVEMVETAAILNQAGAALAGDPRRDRPRHRDLRRPVDRLGGDRAPARGQPLPRAVRDAFPRADRAVRHAAAAAQRHRAGQGMARRGGVPARGGAGRRRPLLRHPGRQARRTAAERDRARQGGAGEARSRGSRDAARAASTTCRCSPRRPSSRHPIRGRSRWTR